MASLRQIESNRINAQKSTGPKTEKGRARSSQNALKTGIDARSLVINTENLADYEALSARYFAQFLPITEEERTLVDALVTSEWLRLRYLRAETMIWDHELDGNTSFYSAYSRQDEKLARVDRRLNSALRSYTHTLKQLTALRAQIPPQSEPEATAAEPEPTTIAISQEATEELNPDSALFLISQTDENIAERKPPIAA